MTDRILHCYTEHLTVLRTTYRLPVTEEQYDEWVNLPDQGERVEYITTNALDIETDDLGLVPGYSEDDDVVVAYCASPQCESFDDVKGVPVRFVGEHAVLEDNSTAWRIAAAAIDLHQNVLRSLTEGALLTLTHWGIDFTLDQFDLYSAVFDGTVWEIDFPGHNRPITIRKV